MKSRKLLTPTCWIFIALSICSCKKFEHRGDLPKPPKSCELCQYAKTLNKSYIGLPLGINSNVHVPGTNQPDSLEIKLEHIFLNRGVYIDSTVMFFKVTRTYFHQTATPYYDTIELTSNTGYVYYNTENNYFYVSPDTLIIHETHEVPGPYQLLAYGYYGSPIP